MSEEVVYGGHFMDATITTNDGGMNLFSVKIGLTKEFFTLEEAARFVSTLELAAKNFDSAGSVQNAASDPNSVEPDQERQKPKRGPGRPRKSKVEVTTEPEQEPVATEPEQEQEQEPVEPTDQEFKFESEPESESEPEQEQETPKSATELVRDVTRPEDKPMSEEEITAFRKSVGIAYLEKYSESKADCQAMWDHLQQNPPSVVDINNDMRTFMCAVFGATDRVDPAGLPEPKALDSYERFRKANPKCPAKSARACKDDERMVLRMFQHVYMYEVLRGLWRV